MTRLANGAGLLALAILVAGCPDDLQDQISVTAYARPSLSVPAGAVPTDLSRRPHAEAEPATSLAEAEELTNPIQATANNIKQGQAAYERYCSHCHGALGRGWTSVGSSFDPAPPDLVEAVPGKSHGWLFGHIAFGRKLHMPLRQVVTVEERWQIIHFLGTLEERRQGVEPAWGQ